MSTKVKLTKKQRAEVWRQLRANLTAHARKTALKTFRDEFDAELIKDISKLDNENHSIEVFRAQEQMLLREARKIANFQMEELEEVLRDNIHALKCELEADIEELEGRIIFPYRHGK